MRSYAGVCKSFSCLLGALTLLTACGRLDGPYVLSPEDPSKIKDSPENLNDIIPFMAKLAPICLDFDGKYVDVKALGLQVEACHERNDEVLRIHDCATGENLYLLSRNRHGEFGTNLGLARLTLYRDTRNWCS